MTLLFGICLAVGGVTALFSLFAGGGHDADVHGDFGHGDVVHGDTGAGAGDGHVEAHGHAAVDGNVGEFWLLFVSLRFWVFFLTFFGLAGLGMQLAGAGDLAALLLAGAMGGGLGLGASWAFRALAGRTVSSAVSPNELVGLEARVMLPVGGGEAGKVRLALRGQTLDRVAFCEGTDLLARGERALVIAVRGDRLLVSRAPTPELEAARPADESE